MKQNRLAFFLQGLTILTILLIPLRPAAGQAATQCWSSPGASAVLDSPDLAAASQGGPVIQVSSSAPLPAGFDGRFGISGIFQDNFTINLEKTLRIRYRDNGPEARVRLELRQVNLATGAATTLALFDSDAFPQSASYQVQTLTTPCTIGGGFDFFNYVYFINLIMDKTGPNGSPSLWLVQSCSFSC